MAKKTKKRGKIANKRNRASVSANNNFRELIRLEFALNLIAAIIVLVSGLVYIAFPMQLPAITGVEKALVFEILIVVIGLGMLISTMTLRTNPRGASVFILVFSVLALIFPPYGFVIGPVIGLIASIVILAKLRRR